MGANSALTSSPIPHSLTYWTARGSNESGSSLLALPGQRSPAAQRVVHPEKGRSVDHAEVIRQPQNLRLEAHERAKDHQRIERQLRQKHVSVERLIEQKQVRHEHGDHRDRNDEPTRLVREKEERWTGSEWLQQLSELAQLLEIAGHDPNTPAEPGHLVRLFVGHGARVVGDAIAPLQDSHRDHIVIVDRRRRRIRIPVSYT